MFRAPRHHGPERPSNRSFGGLFFVVFVLLAAWQAWRGTPLWMGVWLAAAVATGAVTLFRPRWLAPFNRAWMTLGDWLGRIVSPVELRVLYAVLIVPAGLVMRVIGRNVMPGPDPRAASYWLPREDGAMAPERFKNQF